MLGTRSGDGVETGHRVSCGARKSSAVSASEIIGFRTGLGQALFSLSAHNQGGYAFIGIAGDQDPIARPGKRCALLGYGTIGETPDAIRRTDCHRDQMGTPELVSWIGEPGMQVARVTLRSGLGWRLR